MSIFRFKVWWSTHWIGHNGKDAEVGTQMMILDRSDSGRPYVLLLPLFEGSFSSSLQAGVDDYMDICVESGSSRIHVGDDPYTLVRDAMKVVKAHSGAFKLLEEKSPPNILWTIWLVHLGCNGVKGLLEGGCPPKWVLIDDGAVHMHDDQDPIPDVEGMDRTGTIMPNKNPRLKTFEVNYKFKDYESPKVPLDKGMGAFIEDLKEEFRTVEDAYVWHAFLGYWGGVRPKAPAMPESKVIVPRLSQGLQKTMDDLAANKILTYGIGFVPPELAYSCTMGSTPILSQLGLMVSRSMLFIHLWGPIYVSHRIREHNFKLLKTLVLPDGSILLCHSYALPTRDCPFQDPLRDGETMLKLWNLNKYTGILGLFNCQGGGWCCITRRSKGAPRFSNRVDCLTTPEDIEWENGMNSVPMEGVYSFAVYLFQKKKLKLMGQAAERLEFSSAHLVEESDIPKYVQEGGIQFAPIGLVNMMNSGGAIQSLEGSGEMKMFASERPKTCKIDGVEVEFCYTVKIQVPWHGSPGLSVIEYLF
ncbi:hypothetical protein P3X46_030947 [Hevea brasiliensis]|uniref:Galactinol--sucrose galactosyltransferase n=1 Tax=Hevea brasiliensis TaxID=3981 RepID=A0ABQ9KLW4_HEVBR|nr:hypothetical protein P3X46_030947 [Hevea brasiliensis]